ncbi:MAG: ROK family protein [Bacteroidales bacterium]|nr:ROK family protein [Bacteroidales bacterium]
MKPSYLDHDGEKNFVLKRKILEMLTSGDHFTIAHISKEVKTSIPTTTKFIDELVEDRLIIEKGKIDTAGGRKPNVFGLNPDAGYMVGVEVTQDHLKVAISNFIGNVIGYQDNINFKLENTRSSLGNFCDCINKVTTSLHINKEEILAYGISLSGRVNPELGYSFAYDLDKERPVDEILTSFLGKPVAIENDSRAMCYGEYTHTEHAVRDMLFLNVSWGLGMGLIIDKKLFYGKSGYSGEIGHFPMLDNNLICRCGKTGCLETGASGSAIHRIILEKLDEGRASCLSTKYKRKQEISLDDILDAIKEEDVLTLEVVEQVGDELGKAIAGLINIFNPELVILGGRLAEAKEYILLPVRTAINKHSLHIVSRDTKVELSVLGGKSGPIGACMLARNKFLRFV